jgi:hypothetical protein
MNLTIRLDPWPNLVAYSAGVTSEKYLPVEVSNCSEFRGAPGSSTGLGVASSVV